MKLALGWWQWGGHPSGDGTRSILMLSRVPCPSHDLSFLQQELVLGLHTLDSAILGNNVWPVNKILPERMTGLRQDLRM